MKLSEITVGDVVLTENKEVMLVVDIESNRPKNPIVVSKKVGKEYICSPNHVIAVIGTFDPDKVKHAETLTQVKTIAASLSSTNDLDLPQRLRDMDLKVGVSKIRVQHGGKVITATFADYKPSRWKHPVTYITPKGGKYKCPPDNVLEKIS